MGAKLSCCVQNGATKDEDAGNDGSRAFRYVDEDGSDLFFSARQSLSNSVIKLHYPPASTRKSGKVSFDIPESLLHSSQSSSSKHASITSSNPNVPMTKIDEEKADSTFQKRPTEILKDRLTEEFTKEVEIEAGYPGELSSDELAACLEFRRRLKEHSDPTYRAMVYLNVDFNIDDYDEKSSTGKSIKTEKNGGGRGPEEEAFALCRFLRARQFDVDKTFAMMDEHIDVFRESLKHNLHRSKEIAEKHINCPLPVFTHCFPLVDYGIAKSGAFVMYLKAGSIHLPDGFDCINTADKPESFVEQYMPMAWYYSCRVFCETMQRLKKENQSRRNNDDDEFVTLAECVAVMDLEGLQRDLFTTRTMEFLKQAFGVIECFPEILNRVVVVNVPYFFTFIWSILKRFIDARTVRKIGFYSSLDNAKNDLLELVDSSQILAEYGGAKGSPTYDEALAMKMKRDGEYNRYVIEQYSSSKSSKEGTNPTTLKTFSLDESEGAELTVYTQAKMDSTNGNSKSGTQFYLLRENDPSIDGNAAEDNGIASGDSAANNKEQCMVHGPGNYRLVVQKSKEGPSIDRALLVISIR